VKTITVFVFASAVLAAFSLPAGAQTVERRAAITGGGDPNGGKCTIEVVVDGAAEVEIRGDVAILRNLQGQPAQWRRFVCSSPMPPRPGEFRFAGVDGRGRQTLIRPAGDGGPAVIRIEDPQSGLEGYTFDIMWRGGAPPFSDRDRDFDRDRDRDRDRDFPPRRFTVDQAVRVCQDSIMQQARDRFPRSRLEFRRTNLDDNPGRNDWVIGVIEVTRRNGDRDLFRFSCSVDFDRGRVRSAQIEDRIRDRDRDR